MAYIGNQPVVGNYRKLDDISSGFTGTAFEFDVYVESVAVSIPSTVQCLIVIDGNVLEPDVDFQIGSVATKLVLTDPPSSGSTFWGVILGDTLNIGEVSDNSISSGKLMSNSVTEAKISTGAVTVNKIGTGAVTADKLGTSSVTNTKLNDGSVTVNKLANSSVQEAKIADGSITPAKIATTTANSLLGTNSSGVGSLITAGSNVTISGGVISSTGGATKIATATLSSAYSAITFSNTFTAGKNYRIVGANIKMASDFHFRLQGLTTGTTTVSDVNHFCNIESRSYTGTTSTSTSMHVQGLYSSYFGSSGGQSLSFELVLFDPASTINSARFIINGSFADNGNVPYTFTGGGQIGSSSETVKGIKFFDPVNTARLFNSGYIIVWEESV